MRVAVVSVHVPFVRGGAEYLADGLVTALSRKGHDVDLIRIPFHDGLDAVLDCMLANRLFDLTNSQPGQVDLMIGLKFPAYLAQHPTKIVWTIHQYRAAYDLWDYPNGGLAKHPQGEMLRAAVRAADAQAFGEAKSVYSISSTVSRRLATFNNVDAAPILTPPQDADSFFTAEAEDFLFLPSRLDQMKRQDLVIRALAETREPVRLLLAGASSEDRYVAELQTLVTKLNLQNRVRFLGYVPAKEKQDLYARCLGVVFCPLDEDYGYVALESMLASKPLLTTLDAGEPAVLVRNGETGFVTESTVPAIAAMLDQAWSDRGRAAIMGKAARDLYSTKGISWENAVRKLLA